MLGFASAFAVTVTLPAVKACMLPLVSAVAICGAELTQVIWPLSGGTGLSLAVSFILLPTTTFIFVVINLRGLIGLSYQSEIVTLAVSKTSFLFGLVEVIVVVSPALPVTLSNPVELMLATDG